MDDDSPVPNRRSRKIAPVERNVEEEIASEDLHNIEDERQEIRTEIQKLELNACQSPSPSFRDRRLSLFDKNVSEHYRSCIQLAAENKINAKNAFNFKLIDLLHSKFTKKNTVQDFTEASSSLDAGVKIYSCRVDNVHSDTLKMATSICTNKKKKEDGGSGDEEMETCTANNEYQKKKVRKSKKMTVSSNLATISKPKKNTNDSSLNIFSTENFIMDSAIFDGKRVCWHLNTQSSFWKKKTCPSKKYENLAFDLPTLSENDVISETFRNFNFGDHDSQTANEIKEEIDPAIFESDVSFHDVETADEPSSSTNDISVETNDYDEFNDVKSRISCMSKVMSSSDFVTDISKLISNEQSEYRYFDVHSLRNNWISKHIKHWNPLKKKGESEDRKPRPEKKEFINFHEGSSLKNDIFEKKVASSQINNKTATTASREKLLITPVTKFNVEEFFRLKVWRNMFIIPTVTDTGNNMNDENEPPSDFEEMINEYNYDNPNDSQRTLPDQHEDDYVETDVHEIIENNNFIGDNLVAVPNKVCKIELPYMVKDKSVNMKQLKSEIWDFIEPLQKTKIESNTLLEQRMEELEISTKNMQFSDICKRILMKKDKKAATRKDLSIPILFNAILQLANDKNLKFLSDTCKPLVDFVIEID